MITIRRRWIFGPLHNGSWGPKVVQGGTERLRRTVVHIQHAESNGHKSVAPGVGGPPFAKPFALWRLVPEPPFGQQWGQQGGDEERTHQRVLKQTYKEKRETGKSETSERRRIGGEKIKERKSPILSFSPHTVQTLETIQLALHRRRQVSAGQDSYFRSWIATKCCYRWNWNRVQRSSSLNLPLG
jgi:hypothetical protein